MTATLPLVLPGFHITRIAQTNCQLQVHAHATTPSARCLACGFHSSRVHSYYARRPNDLPSSYWRLHLHLLVRRFSCTNTTCPKKTFAERLAALIKPFARRTERLTHALRQIGFALGGQAGARWTRAVHMPTSADTLLRIVAKTPMPETGQPRVVDVDEWAWRRGHRYGTILVDLEARQVLDLLPGRSAHSLAQWLKAHPSIAILTRDRSVEYVQGMRLGAPEAVQVADRWHFCMICSNASLKASTPVSRAC